MDITNATALVTGANRGIGRALVHALLAAGARRVYAGARDPAALDVADARVVKLRIDVTDAAAVAALPDAAPDITLLVNNAGILDIAGPFDTTDASLAQQFAVNVGGPLHMARAFAPVIERNGGGGIVNMLSMVSFAAVPSLAGYSASKAAAWSVTQSLRATLAARGIAVFAVFPGPVDTAMTREFTLPKTSAEDVARAILAGIAEGRQEITPDPMGQQVFDTFRQDFKALERQFAG